MSLKGLEKLRGSKRLGAMFLCPLPFLQDLDRPNRIIKMLRFEHTSQNTSGVHISLYSIVCEWAFGTRVLSTQPETLPNTKE